MVLLLILNSTGSFRGYLGDQNLYWSLIDRTSADILTAKLVDKSKLKFVGTSPKSEFISFVKLVPAGDVPCSTSTGFHPTASLQMIPFCWIGPGCWMTKRVENKTFYFQSRLKNKTVEFFFRLILCSFFHHLDYFWSIRFSITSNKAVAFEVASAGTRSGDFKFVELFSFLKRWAATWFSCCPITAVILRNRCNLSCKCGKFFSDISAWCSERGVWWINGAKQG